MNETDLLPCPFCGSDAVLVQDFTGLVRYWSVQCKNEDCLARSGYHLKARSAMEQESEEPLCRGGGMSDLISRQDAIDALNDVVTITGYTNATVFQDYVRRVNNRLQELPSAQPNLQPTCNQFATEPSAQPEIIRCKDCIDYPTDGETSYSHRRYCPTTRLVMPADGFCSYAERREE